MGDREDDTAAPAAVPPANTSSVGEQQVSTVSKKPAKPTKLSGKLLEESKQRSIDVITGTQSLLTVVILGLACIVAFSSRLFAVIRFESIIHEFDPWLGISP